MSGRATIVRDLAPNMSSHDLLQRLLEIADEHLADNQSVHGSLRGCAITLSARAEAAESSRDRLAAALKAAHSFLHLERTTTTERENVRARIGKALDGGDPQGPVTDEDVERYADNLPALSSFVSGGTHE